MALTETFQDGNRWREANRYDGDELRRQLRPNRWSDAAALGEEVEVWLSTITRPKRPTLQESSFLASAEAQLPGTGKNNWREPLDEMRGTP